MKTSRNRTPPKARLQRNARQLALELEEPLQQVEHIRQALVWVGLGQLSVANDGGGAVILLADLLQDAVAKMRAHCSGKAR